MTLFGTTTEELEALKQTPTLPALADLCRTADAMSEAVDEMVAALRAEEPPVTWRVLAEVTHMTQQGLMARQARLAIDRSLITEEVSQ